MGWWVEPGRKDAVGALKLGPLTGAKGSLDRTGSSDQWVAAWQPMVGTARIGLPSIGTPGRRFLYSSTGSGVYWG